jgi:lysophospholipase L1-like esterase
MKMKRTIIFLLFSVLIAMNGFSQGYHVRIAFVGNSITIGANLLNPTVECYPSRVSQMLQGVYGDTCVVNNYAVSGRTMLKKGDYPIWNEKQFGQMWNFAPDIVFIMMGTNDSKPYNWDVYGNEFFTDYMSMIDTMKERNPRTQFMLAFPPPAFAVNFDIRDSVILNCIRPLIDSIRMITGAEAVDFYYAFKDSVSLFPDNIHPNAQGSLSMGKMVFEKFIETNIVHKVETGFTYVTGITTNKRIIATGESATLSWTSINADSVFFDGVKVDVNGSITVSPAATKVYTAYAYGAKSIDSMKFEQTVYIPELTKIAVKPLSSKITQHDSVDLILLFSDQQSKAITGKTFDVVWSIREGGGYLINKTATSATFVGSEAGKSYIVASVGSVFVEARVTVEAGVGIFDLKGALQLKENYTVSKTGKQTFLLKTNKLKSGIYLFEVEGQDLKFSGKFRQQ